MAIVVETVSRLEMPTILCEQCGTPIGGLADGLCAWASPAPPQSGFLEARFVHRACAAYYEESHGVMLRWKRLADLWQDTTTRPHGE
jgi:hypothetical protein